MTTAAPNAAAWAAREVGLPADATPAEVRAALLREVTRAGFVPTPARQRAWQVLCPPSAALPRPPHALAAEEDRLRAEVDDFAAAFFATPVGARRERWQALSAECAFAPPLAARLKLLEPGLDLRLGDIGNPRTAQLASHVAGLFVLGPAARAAQRQAVLRALQTDIAGWEEAAKQLQAVCPALTALEPTLIASILSWREQQQRLARARAARQPPAPRPAALPREPEASGGKTFRWAGVLAIIFLAIRLCGGMGSYSPNNVRLPDPPPRIEFRPPPPPPRLVLDPADAEKLKQLREAVEEMEREQRNKQRETEPRRP